MKPAELIASRHVNCSQEYSGAYFGDYRLERRLLSIADRILMKPTESFPTIFSEESELEAFYRFLRNPSVSFEKIIQPHYARSCSRVSESKDVLLIHDTSNIQFHRKKHTDLGMLNGSRKGSVFQVGFPAHFSMAVAGVSNPQPLGIIQVTPLRRLKLRKIPRAQYVRRKREERDCESSKWINSIRECRRRFGDAVNFINVMDREADYYSLMSTLVTGKERFVIRVSQMGRLAEVDNKKTTVAKVVSTGELVCEREVCLSERRIARGDRGRKRNPPRLSRMAKLSITTTSISIRRSENASAKDYPNILTLNVVHAFEINPPPGEKPVDWKLYTTEPINDVSQVLRVVDIYRARWIIEEFFKALKTGCSYEDRQLETFKTAMNALALMIPIAWQMLQLRYNSRTENSTGTEFIFTPIQIAILRSISKGKLTELATAKELLISVAALGGHIKNNGDPGWLVLYRGMRELHSIERGAFLDLKALQHVINH
jgi:hypothetical protein